MKVEITLLDVGRKRVPVQADATLPDVSNDDDEQAPLNPPDLAIAPTCTSIW